LIKQDQLNSIESLYHPN